jgi:eukaryotic-like serine/threonine-protein kinase
MLAGRYRIGELLGEGGMGAVYRGEHLGLQKPVAIKLLHRSFAAHDEIGARFQREAFVGGRLDHPNCVTVMDFGIREDGAFFLVMELLRGQTLQALLDRDERVPWQRALHIARHVLRGLAHAHGQGVVHRDIKPANIFLEPTDDDPDFAKVLDFGIAKLLAAAARGGTTLTQVGATLGTPTYLSPEQAMGQELDPATDLYSLSIVLYEMITGTPPFVEDDALSQLRAHTTSSVPPFAEVAPDIEVPAAVEALVRRGLAKDPRQRPGSAAEMIAVIDEIRGSLGFARAATPWPVPARAASPAASPAGDTTGSVAGPPRWRTPAIGAAAALVLAIGVLAARGGGDEPEPPAPRIVVPTPMPVPMPVVPAAPPPDPAVQLKTALRELDGGRTCAARRGAVQRLRALGDPAAIPALRRARVRETGGFLGMGAKNANACLRADAEAAITALTALKRDAAAKPGAPSAAKPDAVVTPDAKPAPKPPSKPQRRSSERPSPFD